MPSTERVPQELQRGTAASSPFRAVTLRHLTTLIRFGKGMDMGSPIPFRRVMSVEYRSYLGEIVGCSLKRAAGKPENRRKSIRTNVGLISDDLNRIRTKTRRGCPSPNPTQFFTPEPRPDPRADALPVPAPRPLRTWRRSKNVLAALGGPHKTPNAPADTCIYGGSPHNHPIHDISQHFPNAVSRCRLEIQGAERTSSETILIANLEDVV